MAMTYLTKLKPEPMGAHSLSTAYGVNSLVMSEDGVAAYISVKDVPAGTPLTNTEYWKIHTDLSEVKQSVEAAESERAKAESGRVAAEEARATEFAGFSGEITQLKDDLGQLSLEIEELHNKSIITSQNIADPSKFGPRGTWYFRGKKYTTGNTTTDNSVALIFRPVVGETYYVGRYRVNNNLPVSSSNFAVYFTAWDENGNYLPYDKEQNVTSFTVLPDTAKIALTIMRYPTGGTEPNANVYIGTEPCPAKFIEYSEYDLHSAKAVIDKLVSAETLNINLPGKMYAVVGAEFNIYFDNIISGSASDYSVNVDCAVGAQLDRCFRLTPETTGSYPITVTFEKNGVEHRKESTIVVTNADSANEQTVKVIVIGDSTTNGGVAVHKLIDDAAGKRFDVVALGTRGNAPYLHEGRSGWRADLYVNAQTDGTYTNAFYNPATQKFDFGYYLAQNNIDTPDLVIINLGINDVFAATSNDDLKTSIDAYNAAVEYMITSIRSVSNTPKVGIAITIPPNYSQDSFGKACRCNQNRVRYKLNNNAIAANIIEQFSGRDAQGVYVFPIYANLDTVYNMETEQMQVNARNDATYTSPTGYASLHPATSGLWQIADVYWYVINAIWSGAY